MAATDGNANEGGSDEAVNTTCIQPIAGLSSRQMKKAKSKNPAAVALGSIRSPAKAKAARINGRLGGRPKQTNNGEGEK